MRACVYLCVRAAAGRKVVYGTDDGVYISDLREQNRDPVKMLALTDVAQVDVLDDYGLLIVLSGESPPAVRRRRAADARAAPRQRAR